MQAQFARSVEKACVILVFAAVAYAIYAWIVYGGPYRWLAELSLQWFGSYEPKLIFFATCVVLVGPPAVVLIVLAKLAPDLLRRPVGAAPQSIAARVANALTQPGKLESPAGLRVLAGIGVAALAVGAGAGWLGYQKSMAPVTFVPFEVAGKGPPPASHVALTGIAVTGLIVEHKETISGSTRIHTYFPLIEPGWSKSEPIRFFVRPNVTVYRDGGTMYRLHPDTPPFKMTQTGVLFRNDLPGLISAEYEKHGFKLASPHYVLDTDPGSDVEIYWIVAGVGGIGGLV
ncbi:MAG: hypothetical protein HY246_19775, partial [Proteobacteria bacterium]|nr:hypothetical protein [Pseudomonadota bacterium]